MKMTLKRENNKFSAMTLKPISGPICFQKRSRSPKKPVAGQIGLGNHYKTQKPWAIAHENVSKT